MTVGVEDPSDGVHPLVNLLVWGGKKAVTFLWDPSSLTQAGGVGEA